MAKAGLIAIAALAGLAACAEPAPPPPPPPPPPVVAPPPPPPPPPEPPREADTCRRSEHLSLIGRPRSEIPVFPDPQRVRVACTTCPVTQDLRPDRLNILFDQTSGTVTEVRCG